MKVFELLYEEEQRKAVDILKDLNKEFKELANKYKLTLVSGMGWPNFTKEGAWMGGGLGPMRGISDDKAGLSIANRRKGFIFALAKKLEALVSEGRIVKIGRGATRSAHTEVAVAGNIQQQLFDNLQEDMPPGNVRTGRMPCLVWFVSNPKDAKLQPYLALQIGGYHFTPGGKHIGFGTYLTFEVPEDKETADKIFKWASKMTAGKKWDRTTRTETVKPWYYDFARDVIAKIIDLGGDYTLINDKRGGTKITHDDLQLLKPHITFEKARVIAKGRKIVPLEPLLPLFRQYGLSI